MLSAHGRVAYPIAVGPTPEGSAALWSEAPLGPPQAVFVAERR